MSIIQSSFHLPSVLSFAILVEFLLIGRAMEFIFYSLSFPWPKQLNASWNVLELIIYLFFNVIHVKTATDWNLYKLWTVHTLYRLRFFGYFWFVLNYLLQFVNLRMKYFGNYSLPFLFRRAKACDTVQKWETSALNSV